MISFIAHADGSEHPHMGNSEVPVSLFVILGITAVTVLVAVIAAHMLSKKPESASKNESVDKES